MNKIKVSKKVKEDLDKVLEVNDKFTVLNKHILEGWSFRESLNYLAIEDMAKILEFGYELEKTPEQEILEIYNKTGLDEEEIGVRKGIELTLNKLNIKIEGINA